MALVHDVAEGEERLNTAITIGEGVQVNVEHKN